MDNNQTQPTNQPKSTCCHLKTWQWVSVLVVAAVIVGGVLIWSSLNRYQASNGLLYNDEYYFSKALESNDESLCENIKQVYVTHQAKQGTDLMIEIPSKHGCFNSIAMSKKDFSICNKILPPNLKTRAECFSSMANKVSDERICDFIQIKEDKYWCYTREAVKKKDFEICQNIPESKESYTPNRDRCYVDVAKESQNFSICDKVATKDFKTYCVALSESSKSICEQIENRQYKDQCLRDIRAK